MGDNLQDLSAERMLADALSRADRQRYFDKLHIKEQADIRIAENYLISIFIGRQDGVPYEKCIPAGPRKWLIEMLNKHHTYFGGIPMIKGITN